MKQIWFLTGSQGLYGPETLEQVATQSKEIATALADGLGDDAVVGGERVRDPARLGGHLLEHVLAVEALAPGEEPDLTVGHWRSPCCP